MRYPIGPAVAALILLAGCAGQGAVAQSPSPAPVESVAPAAPSPTETPQDQGPAPEELFAQLPEEFLFASGAGAWSTVLSIGPDGSFTGEYHDADMGGTAGPETLPVWGLYNVNTQQGWAAYEGD